MELVEWIVRLGLIFLGVQYCLGPILVWLSQKMPEVYRFSILDSTQFLSERSDIFLSLHQEILSNEFEYVGSSEMKMSHCSMYFSIYYNSTSKLCCSLSSAYSQPSSSTQLEFTQLYENGTVLNINNNPLFHVYPDWDKKVSYRFPDINKFSELLSIANRLIAKHNDSPKSGFEKGKEFQVLENHLTGELFRLVSLGWASKNIRNGERRLTPKGAIFLTWQLCWPVKKILSTIDIKRSARALEKA